MPDLFHFIILVCIVCTMLAMFCNIGFGYRWVTGCMGQRCGCACRLCADCVQVRAKLIMC